MKRQYKYISFILALFALLSLLIPSDLIAIDVGSNGINESYVSAIDIKETITGLAPFDKDNAAGNDSGPNNNIVRSFDNINYTLEYITDLKTNTPITEAYLMVEFTLPYPKEVATFDMGSMVWMKDPVLTVKNGVQILTGKRHLQNTADSSAIPGQGTLSIGIKVQAATHGSKIQPTFKLWMEGNSASEAKQITSQAITVSAAPKYNVKIGKNAYLDWLGYFDLESGTGGKNPSDGDILGRIQSYGIGIEIRNDSSAKGFKGIELPQGDISFDLTIHEGFTSSTVTDLTQDPDYAPIVWDYYENRDTLYGHQGRYFNWTYSGLCRIATNVIPRNKIEPNYKPHSCYDGGTWSMTQISDYTYRFTIKDYKFDYENWHFPDRNTSQDNPSFDNSYIGVFSAGQVQIICRFKEDVSSNNEVTNVYLQTTVSNLQVKTASNQQGKDVLSSDDKRSTNITIYPPGSLCVGTTFLNRKNSAYLSTNYWDGDASGFPEQDITMFFRVERVFDYPTTSIDHLAKFDDKAFDIAAGSGANLVYMTVPLKEDKQGTIKTLYAAKPDKTGWVDEIELTTTRQEQLIYFTTIDELKSKGYTCVGVLVEVRDALLHGTGWTTCNLYLPLTIKSEANVNTVYEVVKDTRVWDQPTVNNFTMQGKTYPYTMSGKYLSGYPTPASYVYADGYEKSVYNNDGVMTGGHRYGYLWGNSLLVVGYKASIKKEILDFNKDGSKKTAYDMDINERIVTFGLTAKATTDIVTNSSRKTNLYITDTLPKDLTYIEGTSYYGNVPFEPTVTKNADGTTDLKWTISNITLNQTSEKIKFSCTIGKAGTSDDVYNNQSITNKVKIIGDADKRVPLATNGNYSEITFSIIKLNAVSISKSTSTPFVSIGQDFSYTLKFANNAQNILINAGLYDVLPYTNDNRHSNFTGFYKINNIVIDFSNAPKTFISYVNDNSTLKHTTSTAIRSSSFDKIYSFNSWASTATKSIDSTNKKVTFTNIPANTTALLFNLSLDGFEYIEITINMSPTGTQTEGALYINDFYEYANGQVEAVHSNVATVQIYGHLDVTKIWQDDGNKYNTRSSALDIKVYQNGNEYKNITLTPNNAIANNSDKWAQRINNVPLYDNLGNPYIYTIQEDLTDINQNFYFDAIYDQKNLTVTNIGIWVKNNEFPEYMIIVNKDIINKNNQIATVDDFNKIKLNNNQEFQIVLKQLNRTIINNGTTLSESYSGYSGNEYHGIVTDTNQLIFRNIPAGKYEISENIIQYFEFIGIEKIENSEHATFTVENGKYYITLSGLYENNEHIEVKVTNKIEDFRPYDKSPSQDNLFKGPSQ